MLGLRLAILAFLIAPPAWAQTAAGDVFVSEPGKVLQYSPAGQLRRTLEVNRPGDVTGSTFDRDGNFYVTAFQASDVVWFTSKLTPQGSFGHGYENNPESILFDSDGNCYVGAAQQVPVGPALIKKFTADGRLLETYRVKRERKGADWIDLAADGKTLLYSSEGAIIARYDVRSQTQLSDFTHAGSEIFALRILPDGGVLAANGHNVIRLDSSGQVTRTYQSGSRKLFALNLDPDGKSFWTAEALTGEIYRIDLATGSVITEIRTGSPVGGLSIYRERMAVVATTPPPPAEPPPSPPPPPPASPPPPPSGITLGAPLSCIFGIVPPKSAGETTIDLSTGKVTGQTEVEIRSRFHARGVVLEIDTGSGWNEVTSDPIRLTVDENSPLKWPVRLRTSDCPASVSNPPEIEVRAKAADGSAQQLRIPVSADIRPGPWLHCWWPVLAGVGALVGGWIVFYGFWAPSRFESRMGVMLGQEEDLDGSGFFFPIHAQRGSRSGFYRDAAVYLSQDFRIGRSSRNALVHLRADKKRVKIRPVTTVWRQGADGEWEELPHGETVVRPGVLHRNDLRTIYFEIRIR